MEEAIRRQIQWAQRGHNRRVTGDDHPEAGAFYRGKAKAGMQRAQAMQRRLERERVEKPRQTARINLKLEGSNRVGRTLVVADDLGFTYTGEHWLFRGAKFFVERGERVAITGPNGSGKSTLVRLLLGQLDPTEGKLYRTPLRLAYLAQEMENLDPTKTVLEEATGNCAENQPVARTFLACLLFPGETVQKKVAVLSGGEKVRLALAKVLLATPDLLVLDEPTNGLDLPSRERVEEALLSYGGTLVFVSHDRRLLERVATRILSLEDGAIRSFMGGYREFVARPDCSQSDAADRRLLLEMRLSHLAAMLSNPPAGEAEKLNEEFIRLSRELRNLRA